jgi:acyl carrier protein phosphodiesterase
MPENRTLVMRAFENARKTAIQNRQTPGVYLDILAAHLLDTLATSHNPAATLNDFLEFCRREINSEDFKALREHYLARHGEAQ